MVCHLSSVLSVLCMMHVPGHFWVPVGSCSIVFACVWFYECNFEWWLYLVTFFPALMGVLFIFAHWISEAIHAENKLTTAFGQQLIKMAMILADVKYLTHQRNEELAKFFCSVFKCQLWECFILSVLFKRVAAFFCFYK